MKTHRIGIYPEKELFEKIEKKCLEDDRSYNYFVLKVLREFFKGEVSDA